VILAHPVLLSSHLLTSNARVPCITFSGTPSQLVGSYVMLKALATTGFLCLDAHFGGNGQNTILWNCDPNNVNQRWLVWDAGGWAVRSGGWVG
jgi:hypothetical protein